MKKSDIAKIAHELNKAYCESMGDQSQPSWEDAPDWQKSSAINGVQMHLDNPNASPSDSHESWLKQKTEEGWKYGPVKDPEKKEHPCYVPYDQLPESQKAKDYIFRQTVHSLKPFLRVEHDGVSAAEYEIVMDKQLRRDIDEHIQEVKDLTPSRERSLAITKLQEGVMWLGMDLKRLNEPNPYPSSKDPNTGTVIEPTADGLKL